jgi:hypothetical protein
MCITTRLITTLAAAFAVFAGACTPEAHHPAALPGVSIVFVDYTESMTQGLNAVGESQAHAITWLAASHRGDLVATYFLDQRSSRPHEVTECISGGQASEADLLREGPAAVQRRFKALVVDPINKALLVTSGPDSGGVNGRSPLLEGLHFVTRYTPWATTHGHRRIIIFSDMLQNSPNVDFYRDGTARLLQSDGRPRFPRWLADLKGADVQVELVLRDADAQLQGPQLREEWTNYFKACGAAEVTWQFVVAPSN